MRQAVLFFAIVLVMASAAARLPAQQGSWVPGTYDFYLLNLSWSPAFCDTLKTLTPAEQAARTSTECSAPHAFVLHGLWPQNFDGTYPVDCTKRAGPRNWKRYLDMTPDVDLLKHEWAKHGTCTILSPDAFFSTARQAYTSVVIPDSFRHVSEPLVLAPDAILAMLYTANPGFPAGSFALACSGGRLTSVEACFSRAIHPIACRNVASCDANPLTVEADAAGKIVR